MKFQTLFLTFLSLLFTPLLHAQVPPDDLSGIGFVIDPGHSQNENVGIYGYSEAYKVLDVGIQLREFLRLSNADTVAMTRTDRTVSISVSARATFSQNFAHPNKWFHSIHSDAASMGSSANSILILIPDNCATLSGKICQSKYGNTTISMGNWMSDLMSRTYRIGTRGVYGDKTFGTQFGTNYRNSGLGVFQTSVLSTLSEGGFHTNSRQNLLNMNYESKRSEAKAIWMSMLGHFGVPRPAIRTLVGVITDFESGAPINGAAVTLGIRTYTTNTYENTFKPYAGGDTTLGNGFYYFEGLDAGPQSITVSHPSFGDTTVQVTVIDSFFTFQDARVISALPPRVTTLFPAQGATGILPNATLQLTFSRPLLRSSAESNIYLLAPPESRVAGTFAWSNSDRTVSFKPVEHMLMDTSYRLIVGAGVQDLFNHRLDGNGDGVEGDSLVITFRTRSADVVPPALLSRAPEANTTIGTTNHVINITFDEPLDTTTITNSNVVIQEVGTGIPPTTLRYSEANGRGAINIYSANGLRSGRTYRVRVSGVADQNGNPIPATSPIVWEFSVSATASEFTTIDDFNAGLSNWWQPGASGSTMGIDSASFIHNTSVAPPIIVSSTGSGQLRFFWRTGANDWLVREYLNSGAPRSVLWRKENTRLQVYIYGDASGTLFRFAVDDSADAFPGGTTSNHEVSAWIRIDWVGWRLVEWDLENDPVGTWLGNGKLEGMLRFDSFQIKYEPGASASGQLLFDQLQLARSVVTDINQDPRAVPRAFALQQNYPNPFNPETRISYDVGYETFVKLTVVDILGRHVQTLVAAQQPAGSYTVSWNGRDEFGRPASSGLYLYRLHADQTVITRKMTLLK